jgi:hypothetical protein
MQYRLALLQKECPTSFTYMMQGSIYRWLNPKIITQDHMAIQFIFTDWKAGLVKTQANYPPRPIESRRIPLLSLDDTEAYIRGKLAQYVYYKNKSDEEIPLCNDKDLWRKEDTYKYYKNPQKMSRSTKNFDNANDAYARKSQDGNVGTVIKVPGEVVACKYCPAFTVCKQKDSLIADGSLQL